MSFGQRDFIVSEGWYTQMILDDVVVYHCEFNKDVYDDTLFAQLGVKYNASLERAVVKRKAEFLAGRYCCRQGLTNFQIYDHDVAIGANRAPQWPMGIKGAISHNSHHAMVALTDNRESLGIGIDIESIMSVKTMNDIKEAILRGNEFALLDAAQISPAGALSLIFSFKESFFKAAYPSTGFYFDFDAVTIDHIDYQNKCFELTVNQDLNPQIRPGMKFGGKFTFADEQVISLMVL